MRIRSRTIAEFVIEQLLFLCAAASVLITLGIILVLAFETAAFLRDVPILEFLFGTVWTPLFADKHFGVLPLVSGTLLTSVCACALNDAPAASTATAATIRDAFIDIRAPGRSPRRGDPRRRVSSIRG